MRGCAWKRSSNGVAAGERERESRRVGSRPNEGGSDVNARRKK